MYTIQIENWDVTNLPPLRRISPSRFGLVSKKVWVVLAKIFFSLPGGFLFSMVAPVYFAKLYNLAVCDSADKLENLHWFLLVSQITV